MNYTLELNSARKDVDFCTQKMHSKSPVVEIFSAMVEGKDLSKYGKGADKVTAHIKSLAQRAELNDFNAIAELNTIKKYVIEPKLMEEIKLLGLFGTYENVGYGESIEREVYGYEGEMSRMQALGGDVVFPTIAETQYPVNTVSIGAGYAVDYRKLQLGDMSKENEMMNQIRIDIRNKAAKYVISKAYDAIKNATGVKYFAEGAGITKSAVDDMVKKIRRFGKTSLLGDYSVVSQVNEFAPYQSISTGVNGISDVALEEIRKTSLLSAYNGSNIVEIPNGYDLTTRTADGSNFGTILPEGILFVVPTGTDSPIKSWTRGGITTFTGNDVSTGKVMTRFDIELATDVAKGQEYKLGVISDTNFEIPTV